MNARFVGLSLVLSLVFVVAAPAHATGKKRSLESFPKDFQWCTATAAHQIEGGNSNSDWWDWEQIPGKVKNGEKSGLATDHWNRLDEDTRHLAELGVKTYRFSVEWAKIEPADGQWDLDVVAHYRHEVELLLAQGIHPLITLHHFTFPRWVRKHGGWEWDEIAQRFSRFTQLVFSRIAPEATDWITVNEPLVNVMGGYYTGQVPPGEKRGFDGMASVLRGLLRAHAASYRALHEAAKAKAMKIRVGMAHHLRTFDPLNSWNPLDRLVSGAADEIWNWAIPNALRTGELEMKLIGLVNIHEKIAGLKGTEDFFGLNYYSGDLIAFSMTDGFSVHSRPNTKKTDLGWDIYPKGFYRILTAIHSRFPEVSIFVTENGIADAKDLNRAGFLTRHLRALARAMGEGVPVEGYCYWSWLDNFEWVEGFTPRFGLFEVDYATLARKPRPSASVFRQAAESGKVP